jgi:hypothetical protein
MSVTVYSFTVISTAAGIQNCVISPITKMVDATQNLMKLPALAAQLQNSVQAAMDPFQILNLVNNLASISAIATQLFSSLTTDMSYVTTVGPQEIAKIPECGTNITVKVLLQLSIIASNVETCVQSSG